MTATMINIQTVINAIRTTQYDAYSASQTIIGSTNVQTSHV